MKLKQIKRKRKCFTELLQIFLKFLREIDTYFNSIKEIIRQVRQNQTKWILLLNRLSHPPMSISMELMCMMDQFWNKTRKYEKETGKIYHALK